MSHQNNLLCKFNTISVVQTAFLGDILLTSILLNTIKQAAPNSRLRVVTTLLGKEALSIFKFIDEIIVFDKKNEHRSIIRTIKFAQTLRTPNHLLISPHKSFRSSLLKLFILPDYSVAYDKNSLSFLFDKKVKYNSNQHEVVRQIELLKIFEDYKGITAPICNFESVDNSFIANFELNNVILIAPGSAWKTKMWGKANYTHFVKLINANLPNHKVFLIGAPNELSLCEEIATQTNAINLAGKLTLPNTMYLVSKSKILISNDSAPAHIASLTNTPLIEIYGPTAPQFGFYPLRANGYAIRNQEIKCSPCKIHGSNKCPIGTHQCMKSISPSELMKIMLQILEGKKLVENRLLEKTELIEKLFT